MATAIKLDLVREHPEAYRAHRKPELEDIGEASYLTIEGNGLPTEPGAAGEFQAGIGALYALAYTLKFAAKAAGRDFKVSPLEASWWVTGLLGPREAPPSAWRWKLRVRVPDVLRQDDLAKARAELSAKGKGGGPIARVLLERIDDGTCVHALHVGPYADEQATIEALEHFASWRGLDLVGPHHEVYLSDPRRTPPERLRTIVRQRVAARAEERAF